MALDERASEMHVAAPSSDALETIAKALADRPEPRVIPSLREMLTTTLTPGADS